MSKRTIEEAEAMADAAGLSRKKSKKNKKTDTLSSTEPAIPVPANTDPSETIREDGEKKKSKKDKKDRKRKDATIEPADLEVACDDAEAAKAAKAARKEAKRAKKAADKEAQKDAERKDDEVVPVELEAEAKAARKTERKTKKENAKAAKKEAKNKTKATDSDEAHTERPAFVNPTVSAASKYLTQVEVDAYLESKQIAVADPLSKPFSPITAFSQLPITDKTQLAPFAKFDSPTPIQAAAWPCLLAGRDVVGVAETGSGKTFAFGLPCIQTILSAAGGSNKVKGVRSVMVSPTRELASQIHEQMTQIAEPAGLHVACIYGGVPKEPQYQAMKKANIVVATPGRLNDLINEGVVDLSKVSYCVLDEADRMLEKGFEEEIKKIIGQTPTTGRQTLMFTATWPPSVRDLAMTFMQDPIRITIGDNHTGELRANTRIKQVVEVVDQRAKQDRLLELLNEHQKGAKKNERILIFCLYKKEATRIEEFIRRKGFRVAGIHGDLSQGQRTASLEAFKKGEVPMLVATDVAARGLDIPAVKVVINVTFPLTAEDYVHRIGRTGRAGQDGLAITLFTELDKQLSGALINVLKSANQPVPEDLLKFGSTVKKKGHDAYGAFYKDTGDMKKATKITFD